MLVLYLHLFKVIVFWTKILIIYIEKDVPQPQEEVV